MTRSEPTASPDPPPDEGAYRQAFKSSSDMMIVSRGGTISDANPAALRNLGYHDLDGVPSSRVVLSEGPMADGEWRVSLQRRDGSVLGAKGRLGCTERSIVMVLRPVWSPSGDSSRRSAQLEMLSMAAAEINSSLNMRAVMRRMVHAAKEVTGATSGLYRGYDGSGLMVDGQGNESDLPTIAKEAMAMKAVASGRPYMTNDAEEASAVSEAIGVRARNTVTVPVTDRAMNSMGHIAIWDKREGLDFNEEDVMALQALAGLSAVAIDNVRMLEERERMSRALERKKEDYRTIFNSVPALVALKNAKGEIMTANRAFLRTFGLKEKDLEDWSEIISRDQYYRYMEEDREVISSGRPKYGILEHVVDNEGGEYDIVKDKLPLTDADGATIGTIMFALDVTDQMKGRAALDRERDLLATVMGTVPVGVLVFSRSGSLVFANQAADRILGVKRSQPLAEREWSVEDEDGRTLPDGLLADGAFMSSSEPVFGLRRAVRRGDGSKTSVTVNAAPLHDGPGDPLGVVMTLEDITDRLEAEERLQESLRTMDSMFREIPSGILVFRQEGPNVLLVSANPAAESMLGPLCSRSGEDIDLIWPGGFMIPKSELIGVRAIGRTVWRDGVHFDVGGRDKAFDLRAFPLPTGRICVTLDDVTDRLIEEELRRRAFAQIEDNTEHFATLVDRIRNPLSAIIAHAEAIDGRSSELLLQRTEDIEAILRELDLGWARSETVRAFLKRNL